MPDITMCEDNTCPKFKTCYRAQAEPSPYRQSYFVESPRKGDDCNYYGPMEGGQSSGWRKRQIGGRE